MVYFVVFTTFGQETDRVNKKKQPPQPALGKSKYQKKNASLLQTIFWNNRRFFL